MKNLVYILLLVALVFGASLLWQHLGQTFFMQSPIEEQYASEELKELVAQMSDEAADSMQLALADVFVEQGSEGLINWDLTANWATYTQATGQLDVIKPYIRYNIDNESQVVYVSGEEGRISDNNSLVTLKKDIVATKDDMELTSDYGLFKAEENLLTFPEGAFVTGEAFTATGNLVEWNLTENTLHGEGNVTCVFYRLPSSNPQDENI